MQSSGTVASFRRGGLQAKFKGIPQSFQLPDVQTCTVPAVLPAAFTSAPAATNLQYIGTQAGVTVTGVVDATFTNSFQMKVTVRMEQSALPQQSVGTAVCQMVFAAGAGAGDRVVTITNFYNRFMGEFGNLAVATGAFCYCPCVGGTDRLNYIARSQAGTLVPLAFGDAVPGPDLRITISTAAAAQSYVSAEIIFPVIQLS